jgi:hypothetical protein
MVRAQELVGISSSRRTVMSSLSSATQISVGDEVYGSDGDKVGTVAEVQSGYLVVEKGFFFPTDYYIPRVRSRGPVMARSR